MPPSTRSQDNKIIETLSEENTHLPPLDVNAVLRPPIPANKSMKLNPLPSLTLFFSISEFSNRITPSRGVSSPRFHR